MKLQNVKILTNKRALWKWIVWFWCCIRIERVCRRVITFLTLISSAYYWIRWVTLDTAMHIYLRRYIPPSYWMLLENPVAASFRQSLTRDVNLPYEQTRNAYDSTSFEFSTASLLSCAPPLAPTNVTFHFCYFCFFLSPTFSKVVALYSKDLGNLRLTLIKNFFSKLFFFHFTICTL